MDATRYVSPDKKNWVGRADSPEGAYIFQVIRMLDLLKETPPSEGKMALAILGFCCDEGVRRNLGRPGAAEGPLSIRQVLAKLPVQKTNFICYDAGDIICTHHNLENAQETLSEAVSLLLANKITPIILGGGHELAWGHYRGIVKTFPQKKLGIVNFDAHFDMRPILPNKEGTSGTPFLQIAEAAREAHRRFDYNCIGIQRAGNIRQVFDTAKSYHVETLLADDLHQGLTEKTIKFLGRIIKDNQIIYQTLDLDVFSAAYAPGVSAPQAMGLIPWEIIPLVRRLASSSKVIGYDVAELVPKYDVDQRTAKLAANIIYEIMHYHKAFTGEEGSDHV